MNVEVVNGRAEFGAVTTGRTITASISQGSEKFAPEKEVELEEGELRG